MIEGVIKGVVNGVHILLWLVILATIVIPLATDSAQGGVNGTDWSVLGDHWGGNSRARELVGRGAYRTTYFPLHKESEGDGFQFTMAHRCPANCRTDFSTTCTNERELSNSIFAQATSIPDPRGLSSWAFIMGQFADHDFTRISQVESSQPFCSIDMSDLGPSVQPLPIHRTVVAAHGVGGCRDPIMKITPYLDLTTIYGDYVDPERASRLREYTLGRLKMTKKGYLTRDPENPNEFLSGDVRATEHALLATLHTLFSSQHNKIAGAIHQASTSYSDEQLFWKARRVNVAQYQRMLYEEYLPSLLGSLYDSSAFGVDGVDAACSPSHHVSGTTIMKTEFAEVAYRFGHSQVPNSIGPYPLIDLFFNATRVEEIGLEALIAAAQQTPSERVDASVVDALRNMLFGTHGLDLVSMNIARGRELGVSDFNSTLTCYSDTFPPMRRRVVRNGGPIDDLFVRLLQEPLAGGSSVPAPLGAIILSQYLDLCRADPFFYTREQTKRDIGRMFYDWVPTTTLKGIIVNNTAVSPASIPDNAFFLQ